MTKKIKSTSLILLLTSFFLPFAVYLYTLCPTISVYADAGEYPTFAAISGFAHPPGYPLFILILKLFLLLPFGNIAYKANLASAFIGALSVSLFYLLSKLIVKDRQAAFIATLTLAFSQIFWKNSLVSEVFTLLAFFVVLTFLLFYLWVTTNQKKYFYWFLLATGFALAHHQLILATLLPLFIWFLWDKKWRQLKPKDFLLAPLIISVGFLPYVYVFFAAQKFPPMNWENPQTLNGLIRLIARSSYGTFRLTLSPGKIVPLYQILDILRLFVKSFSLLGIIFALLGFHQAFSSNRKIFFFSLFVIFTVGFLFAYHSGMPLGNLTEIQYLERFQIIPSLFMSLLISLGILNLKEFIRPINKRFFYIFLALVPLTLFFTNFSQVNQRGNYFGEFFGQDVISDIPQNSIFIFEGDALVNALFYQKYALNQRKDLTLILGSLLVTDLPWYKEEIKHHYPDIVFPNQFDSPKQYLLDFLALNASNKKIFLSIPHLEIDFNLYFPKIRHGLLEEYFQEKITTPSLQEIEDQVIKINPDNYPNLKMTKKYPKDWPEAFLLLYYADPYLYLAQNYSEIDSMKAKKYYQKVTEIAPNNPKGWFEMANFFQSINETQKAISLWKRVIEIEPHGLLATKAKDKIQWEEIRRNNI